MPQKMREFSTIGVITGRDLVGDALIKLPFLRALRHAYPYARVHWITAIEPTTFSGPLREVTRHLIDEIHEMPKWLKSDRNPNPVGAAPAFDLLIDTRNRWKMALESRQLPHRLYLAMAWHHFFSDRRPSVFKRAPKHLADRLLQFVELAAGYMPSSTGALPVPDDLQKRAAEILPDGAIYVGLAPGCSDARRIWPLERFIELAKAQVEKNRVPVFILGPMEADWLDGLRAAVPQALFPLQNIAAWGADKLSLNHTLALGTRLDVMVGNDSGPGHIMAAVDCKIVSLFGPTTPLKAAPRASHVVAVCAQSFGSRAMTVIPVPAVLDAVDGMLVETGSSKKA